MPKKLVYGVGINDADYFVSTLVGNKKITCQYYSVWQGMLERCYSEKFKNKNKTYINCIVCDEWLTFSNFKKWMETQDWEGKHLDKDLLVKGNKLYSPDTCIFIDKSINSFLTDRCNYRGEYPVGVDYVKRDGKFRASCSNGKGKQISLGYYNDPVSAHLAWKSYKHSIACKLAETQNDSRIKKALLERFI